MVQDGTDLSEFEVPNLTENLLPFVTHTRVHFKEWHILDVVGNEYPSSDSAMKERYILQDDER